MKSMKKFIALGMVTILAIGLTACGTSNNENTSDGKTYNIGICQQLEHEALDAATKGFEKALKDELGEENVKINFQNAQNEQANCATIVTGFVADDVDLIMANATSALQAAAAATDTIPIVGTSITDYATALDIDDWDGTTGSNITGTSDLAPLDQQVAMLQELVPDAKKVCILYCSAEPNSIYQAHVIEGLLDDAGIEWKEFTVADSNEIQSVLTNALTECDVVYIPTDNTMAANTELVKNITVPAGIPVIAAEEGICEGGLATLSISYYDIGYAAGKMAAEILTKGTDPGTMPIQTASAATKKYNAQIAAALSWTIPDDYVAIYTEE